MRPDTDAAVAETDADYRLTYDVSAEAWYAHTDRDAPRIGIHRSHVEGGVAWEFHVDEHNLNGPCLQIHMLEDSWAAFDDVPGLFGALRSEQPSTLTELRALLDRLGFADITKRTRPGVAVQEDGHPECSNVVWMPKRACFEAFAEGFIHPTDFCPACTGRLMAALDVDAGSPLPWNARWQVAAETR